MAVPTGPWYAICENPYEAEDWHGGFWGVGETQKGAPWVCSTDGGAITRDDALLIAAAPKLYRACKAVVAVAEEWDGEVCFICEAALDKCECVVADCRAATAGAEDA